MQFPQCQDEYRTAINTGVWHKKLEFAGGETIVMHNPSVMVHFQPSSHPDEWGTLQVDNKILLIMFEVKAQM